MQARSTDHVIRARERILAQFRRAPNLRALVETRARRWQSIEDAAWEVLDSHTIEAAIGIHLDAIGVLVGRGRNDLSDVLYRIALRAQIRINRAQGNARDTLDVASLSVAGASTFSIHVYPPASYVVRMVAPYASAGVPAELAANLAQVRPLGVRGFLSVSPEGIAGARYTWSGSATSLGTDRYSWSGDDQLGGRYSHVIDLR